MSQTEPSAQFDVPSGTSTSPGSEAAPVVGAVEPVQPAVAPAANLDTTLRYAPPARARRMPVYVILSGLLTTAIALIALHFIQEHVDGDIMSFTVRLIIPIGALAVGFVAGLGYGIAAYCLHVRVSTALIWLIVLLQVWAYFAAHFIEFKAMGTLIEKSTNSPIGFLRFYHLSTIYMTRQSSDGYGSGGPATVETLGYMGYFYRGLGIVGFVLGGVIIPLIQRQLPYCPLCQRYMKTKKLLSMPATAKLPAIRLKGKFKLDGPEHQAAFQQALAAMKELCNALKEGNAARVRELMPRSRQKIGARIPVYAAVDLQYCRQCYQGSFVAAMKNNNKFQTPLAGVMAKGDLPPELVEPVIDPAAPLPPIASPAPASA